MASRPARGRAVAGLGQHARRGHGQRRVFAAPEAGRGRGARARDRHRQPRDQLGVRRRLGRQRCVRQIAGQVGDDIQVALGPEVLDQPAPRRNELGVGVGRAQVRVQRAGRVAQLRAPDLGLPEQHRRPLPAIGVEARQSAAHVGRLGRHVQPLIGLQQQLERRDAPGVLLGDQLQDGARGRPGAGLGVDGAQPVAQIGDVGDGARRQHAQQLLEPMGGGRRVPAGQRQLRQRAARLDALRAEDGQLAIERLRLGQVAGPVGQRSPPLDQLLVRDGVADGRGAFQRAVKLPRARPVLTAEGQLAGQRQRRRVVGRVGQRRVQLGQRRAHVAPGQRHARLGDQRVGAHGGLRLGAGLAPVGRVGQTGRRLRRRPRALRARVAAAAPSSGREPRARLRGARRVAQLRVVQLGQPRQDRLLLARAAGGDLQLPLQHLGQPGELAGLGGQRLHGLQRLDAAGVQRQRPFQQHARVARQREALAQDLRRGDQRGRAFGLRRLDARIVGRRNQRARRGVRVPAPRVQLDQPAPGRAGQRPGPCVLDAGLQGGEGAVLVPLALANGRQPVGDLGAARARRRRGQRLTQADQLAHRAGVRVFQAGRLGRSRPPAQQHPLAVHRGDVQADAAAGGQPESLGDEDLVQRGAQRIVGVRLARRWPQRLGQQLPQPVRRRPFTLDRDANRSARTGHHRRAGRGARTGDRQRAPVQRQPQPPLSWRRARRPARAAGSPAARAVRPASPRPAGRAGSAAAPGVVAVAPGCSTSRRSTTNAPASRPATVSRTRPSAWATAIAGAALAIRRSQPPN